MTGGVEGCIKKPGIFLAVILTAFFPGVSYTDSLNINMICGIWKLCYAAENSGAGEIDSGYLVITPDGKFYQYTGGYLESTGSFESVMAGSYFIKGNSVLFNYDTDYYKESGLSKERHGKKYSWRVVTRRYLPAADIVYFDSLKKSVKRPVLIIDSLDYAYAKLY